jgi:hypothetical protein
MQLRTLSPCTQNPATAAVAWDVLWMCCAHPSASTCSCSTHIYMASPAVLLASKFARKALATSKLSKEGAQVHCGSVVGNCVLGAGWVGGSLKAPTQRSERSTRLPQAQRLLTTYKWLVRNSNTATPLLAFHGAHMRARRW